MAKLSSSLVLNKFILNLFGVSDLETISRDLKDASMEGYDENNISYFHHALVTRLFTNENLPKELLLHYDQNIYSHTLTISEKRDEPIKWKYFQYMALLFTEIYLDRYFTNRDAFKDELNNFLSLHHGREKNDFSAITEYRLETVITDLNKLAYWNATGSGKTLIMHVNILQYRYYLKLHNLENSLNRIIVLTPNEGLSKQHLKEFALSGMEAELFSKTGGTLFAGQKIEIIDIHKLEETSGNKTVAVDAFEGNNLVLVDEGHRGSGGTEWKDKRNRLCETGFSFEYSATFGQAVHALVGSKQKALIDEYGKATLFDYSYRYFYKDGYGKDYQILNLNEQWHEAGKEERVQLYLTACLLSFYEQLFVFRQHGKEVTSFLIDKPLAIFVGGKVTKSISKEIASDVVEVLKFFAEFVKNDIQSIERIRLLLEARDGLNNQMGHSIFRNAFLEIRKTKKSAKEVFNDVLKEIFNSEVAGAALHIDNLKGQDGEIGLRIGNAAYFGVINIGDDKGLLKICESHKLLVDEKDFSISLFHEINQKSSKVNVLIGSKKFSEGWSSWRVSTMGLLNIGRGEGSEIIQLFGRGVRLKGYKFSLKRSSALESSIRPAHVPEVLPILETLNIFGLRADYMQQFKDYLEEEGLPSDNDYEQLKIEILPTLANLADKKLKYLKIPENANFKRDVIVDAILSLKISVVSLNWYPKVQIINSTKKDDFSAVKTFEPGKLDDTHLAFLDYERLYFDLQRFKNERSWYNINLSIAALKDILHNSDWYDLKIPPSELEFSDIKKVQVWHEIALALLKSFVERLYNSHKSKYYSDKMVVDTLDIHHPNFESEYNFYIKKSETILIDKIKELKEVVKKKEFKENFSIDNNFESLYAGIHLYQPLIYMDQGRYKEVIKIQPTSLNKGERDLVEDLKRTILTEPGNLKDKQLYLLRNKSRKGMGFFEGNNFYPDFILWIVDGEKQYVSFIDPKGLRNTQGLNDPKITLSARIKSETQTKLNDPNIELNSFIISNTSYEQLTHWKGMESMTDFNDKHIYFQNEQREYYVGRLIGKVLGS
ncbi:MAG: DEAD/DEAH box helicase family protein [Saprospiraceae bacterium]|nr:DEAD/DEAH box helicase family protein [Saprospiraceae bacterium]